MRFASNLTPAKPNPKKWPDNQIRFFQIPILRKRYRNGHHTSVRLLFLKFFQNKMKNAKATRFDMCLCLVDPPKYLPNKIS